MVTGWSGEAFWVGRDYYTATGPRRISAGIKKGTERTPFGHKKGDGAKLRPRCVVVRGLALQDCVDHLVMLKKDDKIGIFPTCDWRITYRGLD